MSEHVYRTKYRGYTYTYRFWINQLKNTIILKVMDIFLKLSKIVVFSKRLQIVLSTEICATWWNRRCLNTALSGQIYICVVYSVLSSNCAHWTDFNKIWYITSLGRMFSVRNSLTNSVGLKTLTHNIRFFSFTLTRFPWCLLLFQFKGYPCTLCDPTFCPHGNERWSRSWVGVWGRRPSRYGPARSWILDSR